MTRSPSAQLEIHHLEAPPQEQQAQAQVACSTSPVRSADVGKCAEAQQPDFMLPAGSPAEEELLPSACSPLAGIGWPEPSVAGGAGCMQDLLQVPEQHAHAEELASYQEHCAQAVDAWRAGQPTEQEVQETLVELPQQQQGQAGMLPAVLAGAEAGHAPATQDAHEQACEDEGPPLPQQRPEVAAIQQLIERAERLQRAMDRALSHGLHPR